MVWRLAICAAATFAVSRAASVLMKEEEEAAILQVQSSRRASATLRSPEEEVEFDSMASSEQRMGTQNQRSFVDLGLDQTMAATKYMNGASRHLVSEDPLGATGESMEETWKAIEHAYQNFHGSDSWVKKEAQTKEAQTTAAKPPEPAQPPPRPKHPKQEKVQEAQPPAAAQPMTALPQAPEASTQAAPQENLPDKVVARAKHKTDPPSVEIVTERRRAYVEPEKEDPPSPTKAIDDMRRLKEEMESEEVVPKKTADKGHKAGKATTNSSAPDVDQEEDDAEALSELEISDVVDELLGEEDVEA